MPASTHPDIWRKALNTKTSGSLGCTGIPYLPIRCQASCIKSELRNVSVSHELGSLCQFLLRIHSGVLDAHPRVSME